MFAITLVTTSCRAVTLKELLTPPVSPGLTAESVYPFAASLSTSELKVATPATAPTVAVPPLKFEPPVAARVERHGSGEVLRYGVVRVATLHLDVERVSGADVRDSRARRGCVAVTLKELLTPLVSPVLDAVTV